MEKQEITNRLSKILKETLYAQDGLEKYFIFDATRSIDDVIDMLRTLINDIELSDNK